MRDQLREVENEISKIKSSQMSVNDQWQGLTYQYTCPNLHKLVATNNHPYDA